MTMLAALLSNLERGALVITDSGKFCFLRGPA